MTVVETGDVLGPSAADASVRGATPVDVDAIGAVQARAWRAAYRDVLPAEAFAELTAPALADAWRPAVADPPSSLHHVLVACSGTAVIGFAAISPSGDPDAGPRDGDLVALVVDPAHQRAGHGSRLLSAAVSALRDGGITTLLAWIPIADEARRAFLVSAGMVQDGARRSYRGPDGREIAEVRLAAALGAE